MFPVNGLEDSMLLKCQCSPHGFLVSIPFLSNSQEDLWKLTNILKREIAKELAYSQFWTGKTVQNTLFYFQVYHKVRVAITVWTSERTDVSTSKTEESPE